MKVKNKQQPKFVNLATMQVAWRLNNTLQELKAKREAKEKQKE
ncbi:hypothetical protein [Pseudomonas phage U1B]|nr:hypothetical protein [Pseudomonas phage T2P]QYV99446.1 hypothetical protein [Pseudomonas phage U1B]QYV99536.1 hypothetical protein [Pseudomonas phage U5]